MKYLLVITAMFALAVALGTYSTENDNFDIEAVVNNPGALQQFVGCFLDKNPCDEVTQAFKKDVPEAVQQACSKCTPAQKQIFKIFLEAIKEKRVEDYQSFKQKFDPSSKFFPALESAIASA